MPGKMGSYKNKLKTLSDLDKAGDTGKKINNPVDRMADEVEREDENSRGVTDYIRNIFND